MSNSRDGKTHMRFPHRIDLLTKSTEAKPSGQRMSSWLLVKSEQICYYVPSRANIRVNPTSEETEKIMLFLPAVAPVDFTTRFENIRDRSGNFFTHLEDKSFEVIEMNHFSNYRGNPTHIQCRIESVIE